MHDTQAFTIKETPINKLEKAIQASILKSGVSGCFRA